MNCKLHIFLRFTTLALVVSLSNAEMEDREEEKEGKCVVSLQLAETQ